MTYSDRPRYRGKSGPWGGFSHTRKLKSMKPASLEPHPRAAPATKMKGPEHIRASD